jgi:hypothetical protein
MLPEIEFHDFELILFSMTIISQFIILTTRKFMNEVRQSAEAKSPYDDVFRYWDFGNYNWINCSSYFFF